MPNLLCMLHGLDLGGKVVAPGFIDSRSFHFWWPAGFVQVHFMSDSV